MTTSLSLYCCGLFKKKAKPNPISCLPDTLTYSTLPDDIIHHLCRAAVDSRLDPKEWQAVEDKDQISPRSLLNLSLVDRRTRYMAVPVIFQSRTISIKTSWSNMPEEKVNDLIDALVRNDRILRMIRDFTIALWSTKYVSAMFDVPAKFGDLLFKLPNLEHFRFNVEHYNVTALLANLRAIIDSKHVIESMYAEGYTTQRFKMAKPAATTETRALLPLRVLTILDDRFQFITEVCPDLQDLTVGAGTLWYHRLRGGRDLNKLLDIKRLGLLHPHLKRLHCSKICEKHVLKELAKHLPQLEDLGFRHGAVRGSEKQCILNHIPYLRGFKNLKHLTIPHLIYLGLGFDVPRSEYEYGRDPGLAKRVEDNEKSAQKRLNRAIEALLNDSPPAGFPGIRSSSGDLTVPTTSDLASIDDYRLPMLEDVTVGIIPYTTVFKVTTEVRNCRRLTQVSQSKLMRALS